MGTEPQSKKAMEKRELNGSKWQSQSNGEQEIINATSLPGRFMKEGEQRFPWRKDKEADYDILYFIVLPEKEPRALFSTLIFCVKGMKARSLSTYELIRKAEIFRLGSRGTLLVIIRLFSSQWTSQYFFSFDCCCFLLRLLNPLSASKCPTLNRVCLYLANGPRMLRIESLGPQQVSNSV